MNDGFLLFDVEADGLDPTKIHVMSIVDPNVGVIESTNDYDRMRTWILNAKVLIGHNIALWDVPKAIEKILKIKVKCKIIDTLSLSWYLYPLRNRHGLEYWGNDFGIQKPKINDWDNLTYEEYEFRCSQDVKINLKLWKQQYRYLIDIYGSTKKVWRLLDYLSFKMDCLRLQEESKWKLDVEYATNALNTLVELKEAKTQALTLSMPKVPIVTMKSKPKRFINMDGSYSKLGEEWIKLLDQRQLELDYEGPIEIIKGYEDGNPSSPEQLKNWLYSLGWKPRTFKYVKDKVTSEVRDIPQINLEQGKGICESIKELYDKEPSLELLDGLSVLGHRIGILKGFLRDQKDGYLIARAQGFTNTLRLQHTEIVNLPKVEKLYAEDIRASLICEDGTELCGSDMAGLEDRLKQHYIYPIDPDYVNSMNQEDWDPHLAIAELAGMMTHEQVEQFKAGDKRLKPIRDIAKNGGYACQYGAGPKRLMTTCGIDMQAATTLHTAYWKLNSAIKQVAEEQTYKTVNDQMWLFNPVSKLWYSLRSLKDIFSTLVQGTASYAFDIWIGFVLKKRRHLIATYHDELITQLKLGYREPMTKILREAIDQTNNLLNLNRELDISVQFGTRYSQIH